MRIIRSHALWTVGLFLILPTRSADAQDTPPASAPASSAEVQQVRDEISQRVDELQQRLADMELENQRRATQEQKLLRLYGFASVAFGRAWLKPTSSGLDAYIVDRATFSVGDFNLFLDSRPAEAWRFLSEIRFVAAPTGKKVVDQTTGEISYADASFFDSIYTGIEQQNGLTLLRVQAEYRYSDALGVTAGRFLTPYGIWNVEHGAPLLIPVRMPYMVVNGVVPRAQTGLVVSGRFFPGEGVQTEYALTVSNGRGPTEQVYDLDDNKAFGLRLRTQLERGTSRIALGTYLFASEDTNRHKRIVALAPVRLADVTVSHETERSMAFDVLIEHGPLRLQGEYVRSLTRYLDNQRPANPLVPGSYLPDSITDAAYALAAFRLPLRSVDLRVYGVFEWVDELSTHFKCYTAGLNWRLTPTVVWKAEGFWIDLRTPDWKGLQTQLALSY